MVEVKFAMVSRRSRPLFSQTWPQSREGKRETKKREKLDFSSFKMTFMQKTPPDAKSLFPKVIPIQPR